MSLHSHHPDRYTRDEKKDVLVGIIRDAFTEQERPIRSRVMIPGDPFAPRAFETECIDRLTAVLTQTEALELLAEMVGAIDEETP